MKHTIIAAIIFLEVLGAHAGAQLHIEPSSGKRVAAYDLDIRLIPDAHRLEAAGTIALPAAPVERATVKFALRADMQTPHVQVVEPKACAGAVKLADAGKDNDLLVSRQWEIKPKRPCPAGLPILLKFDYAGGGEAVGSGFFNLGPDGSFGCGINSAWYPVFDRQRGSGSLRFTVPKGVVVIASGTPTERRDIGDASVFGFTADRPSYFSFAAGPYTIVRRREGRVPVTLYLFKERQVDEELLIALSRAMEVLESEFGEYPFGDFSLVESPSDASKAAGFLGIAFEGFVLARSDYLDRNTVDLAYLGHELSHQWFPFVVGQEGGTTTFMLDEALAHYGSLRTVEEIKGSAAAELHRRGGGDALRLMAAGFDFPLGSLPDERASYSLSNSKGYVVYDMLSRTVGRDKFRTALRNVTGTYAFGRITWNEFLRQIERAAGQDLRWFYQQWFDRGGYPTLAVSWNQDAKSLKYTVTQGSPAYRLELPVQIEFADGSAMVRITHIDQEKTDVVIETPRRVHAVRLDPHFEVFHATAAQRSEADDMRYFTRGNLLWNSNQTDEALKTFQEGLQHLPEVDANGVEFMLRMHIGWIHQEARRLAEAGHEYTLALAQPIRPASYLPRLYLNVATVAQEQGDRERVAWAARNVLSAERAQGQATSRSRQAREILSKIDRK